MANYIPAPREAWQKHLSPTSKLDPLIMEAIAESGETGITSQDIETKINRPHQAVSANLSRLAQRGLIEHSGGYGYTASGRRAKQWRICDQSKITEARAREKPPRPPSNQKILQRGERPKINASRS